MTQPILIKTSPERLSFPLSERVVNNIEQPEEMGHASTDVT